jgi:hypothetical protein
VRVTVQMHVVGFNAAVARAHGYLVKTAPDGHQYAVAKGANSAVVPNTTVPGNCGTATIDYTAIGGKAANVYAGFTVDDGAWLFSWNVSVTDDAGVGDESRGDYLASDHEWYTTWETHHSVTGYSWAEVTSGAAFLDNGHLRGRERQRLDEPLLSPRAVPAEMRGVVASKSATAPPRRRSPSTSSRTPTT